MVFCPQSVSVDAYLKGGNFHTGIEKCGPSHDAAALLHKGLTVLTNVPRIQDTACMMKILEALGCSCIRRGCSVFIDAGEIKKTQVPQEYVRSMRSSIILLGALLGRMGQGNAVIQEAV